MWCSPRQIWGKEHGLVRRRGSTRIQCTAQHIGDGVPWLSNIKDRVRGESGLRKPYACRALSLKRDEHCRFPFSWRIGSVLARVSDRFPHVTGYCNFRFCRCKRSRVFPPERGDWVGHRCPFSPRLFHMRRPFRCRAPLQSTFDCRSSVLVADTKPGSRRASPG